MMRKSADIFANFKSISAWQLSELFDMASPNGRGIANGQMLTRVWKPGNQIG